MKHTRSLSQQLASCNMFRRKIISFNFANTYMLGMLFYACIIVSTTVDNEGKGMANTGHSGQAYHTSNRDINGETTTTFFTHSRGTFDETEDPYQTEQSTETLYTLNEGKGMANTGHNGSYTTNRDINGERTTTFITPPRGTLDETEDPYQTEQSTEKLDTLNETRALESVQTITNKTATGVLLEDGLVIAETNIMLTTTYTDYEFTSNVPVLIFNIPPEIKLISERLLQLYAENDTIGLIALAVSGICPEWIPCLNTLHIHNTLQTDSTCCMTCQCDDSCVSAWNCCPGYESSFTQGQQHQDLELTLTCFNTVIFTNETKVIEYAPNFYMVASCPDHTPQDLKNKCSAMLKNAETNHEFIHAFSDIIPVTDDVTVTNFLNVHCATCNGITNEKLIFWKAEFACDDSPVYITDRNMLERYIQQREKCHLSLLPPNSLIGNKTRCYKDVESRCNITGLWREYDREVEGFCSTINWLYETLDTQTRYRNIFCAICNGEPNTTTSVATCPYERPHDIFLPFTGILNLNIITETLVYAASDYCPAGQLFDPLKDACQNVVCSIPRVLNYITKECNNLFDYISYGLIELPFEFFPIESVYLADIGYYEHVLTQIIISITGNVDCSMHAIFFKLDTPFSMLAGKTSIRYDKIISVIIIVVANIQLPNMRSPSEIINLFLNVSQWAPGFTFRYGRSDLFYLSPLDFDMENKTDKTVKYMHIENMFSSGTNQDNRQYVMCEDPYDDAAVLYRARDVSKEYYCETPYLFDRYHFECPSFLYDIERAGMVRVRNGLLLIDHNITLTFGEFKSLNATHIAVCIESLRGTVLVTQSSGNYLVCVFAFSNQLLITLIVIFFAK